MDIRIKRALDLIEKHPVLPLSAAGVGLSGANLYINVNRSKRDREYQERNLVEMRKLTKNLGKVNNSLEKTNKLEEDRNRNKEFDIKSTVARFIPKGFSNTVDRAISGAAYGSAVGAFLSGGGSKSVGRRVIKFVPGGEWVSDKISGSGEDKLNESLSILGTSILIGAGLGALIGAVQDLNQYVSRKNVGNDRDMGELLRTLRDRGLEENKDFTRSPKTANLMKTKVCVVLKQGGDTTEFNVMVNSINDRRLRATLNKCISKLGPLQTKTDHANNKYNELTLTTIKNKTENVKLVADLVENLVNSGYQVYIVEVG